MTWRLVSGLRSLQACSTRKNTRWTCWVNCSSWKPGSWAEMAARPTSTGLAACMARACWAGKSSPVMLSAAGRVSCIQSGFSPGMGPVLPGRPPAGTPARSCRHGAVTSPAAAGPSASRRASSRCPALVTAGCGTGRGWPGAGWPAGGRATGAHGPWRRLPPQGPPRHVPPPPQGPWPHPPRPMVRNTTMMSMAKKRKPTAPPPP